MIPFLEIKTHYSFIRSILISYMDGNLSFLVSLSSILIFFQNSNICLKTYVNIIFIFQKISPKDPKKIGLYLIIVKKAKILSRRMNFFYI